MDMVLQRCNIRLSNYVSNIDSKSYKEVVKAISKGESRSEELVKLVHGRTKNKHGKSVIEDALKGRIQESDREMLIQYKEELELYQSHKAKNRDKMQQICETYYKEELALLTTIPGIKIPSATAIIAEIGVDMKMFLTAAALVGWAGLRPRNDQSAGKIKSRRIVHGNKYLRKVLVECAWAACRTKGSVFYLKYKRLTGRKKNSQKALIAVARDLLVVIWNILSKKETFKPVKS
jgi:transposase